MTGLHLPEPPLSPPDDYPTTEELVACEECETPIEVSVTVIWFDGDGE